jgi:tetratricopeptide (TPR) repeat protein
MKKITTLFLFIPVFTLILRGDIYIKKEHRWKGEKQNQENKHEDDIDMIHEIWIGNDYYLLNMYGTSVTVIVDLNKKKFYMLDHAGKTYEEGIYDVKEILDLLAWSGNSFMGISLMAAILDKKESELYHPLALGTSLHLLQKTSGAERYDIHQLVRRVRQEQFPIIDRIQWVKNVCQRLGDWFEKRKEDFMDLPDFEAEIDHLKEWLDHVKPYSSNLACRLTWLQSYPPYRWGKFNESLQLVLSAFSLLEEIPGFDPKLKANILDHLGYIYNAVGNLAKGLDYQKKALEIRLEILGEKHADSARSLNNVGMAYGQMGKPNEALKYHVRALEIQRQLFKENNKDIALSLNNVGITYVNLGNFDEALKHQKLALEIQLKLFGEQHPDTALSINNIGATYGCLGDHEEALKYKKKGLERELQLF